MQLEFIFFFLNLNTVSSNVRFCCSWSFVFYFSGTCEVG